MKKEKILHLLKIIGKVLIIVYACIGLICTAILGVNAIRRYLDNNDETQQLNVVATTPLVKGAVIGSQESLVFRDYEFINYAVMGFFTKYPSMVSNNTAFSYTTDYDVFVIDSNHLTDMQLNTPLNSSNILNARSVFTYVREFNEGTYNVKVWNYALNWNNINYASVQVYVLNMGGVNTTITWSTDDNAHFWAFFSNLRPGFGMNDSETFEIMSYVYGVDSIGYETGYSNGYLTGKTEGYNEGYDDGSIGLTNNPFNLLGNAFEGLASILDIQILPHLSLGVLIFTPLIVSIVIVVVKMIKG